MIGKTLLALAIVVYIIALAIIEKTEPGFFNGIIKLIINILKHIR